MAPAAYMTDAMSGLIIREAILPHFKQSPPDYGGGIEAGADAIVKQMSLPPDEAAKNVAAADAAQQQRQHSGGNPLPVFFWLLVIGFVVLSHFRRGGARRYRTRSGGISPWVMLWGLNALSNSRRRLGRWIVLGRRRMERAVAAVAVAAAVSAASAADPSAAAEQAGSW